MKSKLIVTAALTGLITIAASERSKATCWVPAHDVVCVSAGTLDDWDYTDGIEDWDYCLDNGSESWDYDYVYTSADATKPAVESIESHSPLTLSGNVGTYSSLANTEVPTELDYPDPDDCTKTLILPNFGLTSINCWGKKVDTFSAICSHS